MPVLLKVPEVAELLPIAGVRMGITQAGIRKANRDDLSVFLLDAGCTVGAVFTQNRYAAAPVQGISTICLAISDRTIPAWWLNPISSP